jgi:ketosteroid isomerase-like protein
MAKTFDIDAYGRALEHWDVNALLEMYTQDAEFVQINRENPPSAPRVHRGRETLARLFSHCASVGVKSTVHHAMGGDERAAAAVTCQFPDGRRIAFNQLFELRDGRIARQTEVTINERATT